MWNSSTVAHWLLTISIHRIHRATSSVFIWRYLAILYLAAYVGVFGYRTLYIYIWQYIYIYTPTVEYVYIYIYKYVFGIYLHIFYSNWHCFFNSWNLPRCWFQPRRSSLKGCPSITWAETVLMMFIFHILLLEEHIYIYIYWIIICTNYHYILL